MSKKIFFQTAIIVFFLDRITKELVKNFLEKGLDLWAFSINYLTNTGTAFGLLKNINLFFILLTILVLAAIYYYRKDFISNEKKSFFLALAVGGALGNLFDRLFYGFVIDFIDFGFWPAFNIADAGISVGVAVLIYLTWKEQTF